MPLDEEHVRRCIKLPPSKIRYPFDWDELIGEKIRAERSIDLQNREKVHVYPGRYAKVIDFASGRSLVWFEEGLHDGSTQHVYLLSPGGEIRYKENFFAPDRSMLK
jgi:hypothetical protein